MKTKIIEYDRCLAPIDQRLLDVLHGEMSGAWREGYEAVDIVIRRLPANRPTRLVMDYALYETLVEIAKEFRATREPKEIESNVASR